jgi:hypothetical protein
MRFILSQGICRRGRLDTDHRAALGAAEKRVGGRISTSVNASHRVWLVGEQMIYRNEVEVEHNLIRPLFTDILRRSRLFGQLPGKNKLKAGSRPLG